VSVVLVEVARELAEVADPQRAASASKAVVFNMFIKIILEMAQRKEMDDEYGRIVNEINHPCVLAPHYIALWCRD